MIFKQKIQTEVQLFFFFKVKSIKPEVILIWSHMYAIKYIFILPILI